MQHLTQMQTLIQSQRIEEYRKSNAISEAPSSPMRSFISPKVKPTEAFRKEFFSGFNAAQDQSSANHGFLIYFGESITKITNWESLVEVSRLSNYRQISSLILLHIYSR
jgi:hypothetical protein